MAVAVWKGLVKALRSGGSVTLIARTDGNHDRLEAAVRAAAGDIEKIGYWEVPPGPGNPDSDEWEGVEVTGPIRVRQRTGEPSHPNCLQLLSANVDLAAITLRAQCSGCRSVHLNRARITAHDRSSYLTA
ncbi:MAG: hypothetical protein JO242_11410 [Streptosporangiaceae bacterium]|nr:hypothetical protein [Streptosporangiaceae bacterium]